MAKTAKSKKALDFPVGNPYNQGMGKYRRWKPEEDRLLLGLYKEKTNRELGELFGRSGDKISRRLHRLGVRKERSQYGGTISRALKKKYASGEMSQKGFNNPRWIDGRTNTPEFILWKSMRQRCENPNNNAYPNYGARGIAVAERWGDFGNFIDDMGKRPSDSHTLERTDNNKGYTPENCKWATRLEQNNNTRVVRFFDVGGRRLTISDISLIYDIPRTKITSRLSAGWDIDRIIKKGGTDARASCKNS